ncbi:MAG: hypothetical protein RI965_1360 [Bacteroidota bacterium]|jgi:membrane-associated phospholipid phosphatase
MFVSLNIYQSFISYSQQLDNTLMLLVNRAWTHPVLDHVALFMRESIFHIPLYVFLFFISYQVFGKKAFWWILGAFALIAFTDLLSSQVIKYTFNRLRPCRDPFMSVHIRFLAKYCGTNPSFTSSHALNHFAFAAYVVQTFKQISKWFNLLYLWAAIIAYSQIYVGVHYPSDVIVGAFLGILLGWIGFRVTNQALSLHEPRT